MSELVQNGMPPEMAAVVDYARDASSALAYIQMMYGNLAGVGWERLAQKQLACAPAEAAMGRRTGDETMTEPTGTELGHGVVRSTGPDGEEYRVKVNAFTDFDGITFGIYIGDHKWYEAELQIADAEKFLAVLAHKISTKRKLPAQTLQAVKVKPLVWVPTKALRKHLVDGETTIEMTTRGEFLYTLVKNYQIGMSWSVYRGRNHPIPNGTCVSFDQAKAAAQADYTARITAALEPDNAQEIE